MRELWSAGHDHGHAQRLSWHSRLAGAGLLVPVILAVVLYLLLRGATPGPLPVAGPVQGRPTATVSPTPSPSGPSQGLDFAFAVCGDSRSGPSIYSRILDLVQQDGSAFLVHTGDMVNTGTRRQFQAWAVLTEGFRLPFYPVPGNHDRYLWGLEPYLRYSGAPAEHYSFDYGHVHLSMANTSRGGISKGELSWLQEDLRSTRQPIRVVVTHHPPFDPGGTDHTMRYGQQAFLRLMTSEKVNMVLSGHIHSYAEATRDGVRYVITGGAGAGLYSLPQRPAFHHYLRVIVRGGSLAVQVVPVTD